MVWYYHGLEFKEEDIQEHVGFVYEIENLLDGRKYIGQKKFGSVKKIKQKNKKNRKIVRSASNWENYWGSNLELQEDVKNLGVDNFKRTILHLCSSKSMMNYLELKEQVVRDVLFHPSLFYNSYVGGRISRKHVLGKI